MIRVYCRVSLRYLGPDTTQRPPKLRVGYIYATFDSVCKLCSRCPNRTREARGLEQARARAEASATLDWVVADAVAPTRNRLALSQPPAEAEDDTPSAMRRFQPGSKVYWADLDNFNGVRHGKTLTVRAGE